jgi:RNA polymerase sigma factor (sigma-70 family)
VNERADCELLRDYVERHSESAFAELVNRHVALVYSVALRVVVDAHLAEDVTQTTFAILARTARHLLGRALLSSWLHRTASNQAAKLVRGEMRRRAREQEAYAMQTVPTESDPDWNRIAPVLDDALNNLAEADRAVILLRYFEKKTAKEIGGTLQLSEEAAQKRIARALNRLRGLLGSQGAALSTATLATLMATQAVVAVPLGLSTSVSAAALAGGMVAGGITLNTLKLILMSKLKVSVVSALVVASAATPLVLQHQTVTRLRKENSALQEQARQANLLRGENEKLSGQLAEARQGQALSKTQLAELLRLRGEVGPLRRDSQDLAKLRAAQQAQQNDRTAPADARDFVPAAAWANVGADKPEDAMQTFFWAGKHGETNLVGNLLRWQRDAAIPASAELDEKFAQAIVSGSVSFAGKTQGYRVVSNNVSQQENRDEARLGVEITGPDGKTESHTLRLVREDNQWFPVMHVWLEGENSFRAALDVPAKFQR